METTLSGQLKKEITRNFYGNDGCLTKIRSSVMKSYREESRNLNIITIRRVLRKLDTDLLLLPGRHKNSALIVKNIEKRKRSLKWSLERS